MKISVTQDDIDNGVPGNACACPIWRAIYRAIPDLSPQATVGPLGFCSDVAGFYEFIDLPAEAHAFMNAFDNGDPVEPFEFELNYTPEKVTA